MLKLPEEYLKHILDEIDYLVSHTQNLDEEHFSRNETLQRAFCRSLEIIGEAIKNISEDFKKSYPEIEWKLMSGMRDRLIHKYFGVDYQIVWDVVINEIPKLKKEISGILEVK